MLKIKPLTKEQIIISIDRLTRFKNPEEKYLRVFKDILTSNLITPKFKKSQLDEMDYAELKIYAEEIVNYSLSLLVGGTNSDCKINQKLFEYETKIFNVDERTKKLLDNKINYQAVLGFIDETSQLNLKWLKSLNGEDCGAREKYSLRFPVEKIVISEGITEETLLPKFAKTCGYDFDKHGVYVLSAGGKNQVVKLFYKLAETSKLPIYVLMDSDAQYNFEEIKPRLRSIDRVHLIKHGEFEDILPLELVKKALLYGLNNISEIEDKMITENPRMVKNLEEIFRHRGLHEFKKAEFAHMVYESIETEADISAEILEIIEEIRML